MCLLFLLPILIALAYMICLKGTELTDMEFYENIRSEHFARKNEKIIATECTDADGIPACLYVIDRLELFENGSWFVARYLNPAPSFEKGFLSSAALIKPTFKSKKFSDTAKWEVDIGTMDSLIPNAIEFSALFSSGRFPLDREIAGNVTVIGVATGGLMSFMGLYFKNLNVTGIDIDPQSAFFAIKWFGYQASGHSKIVIMDGAEYIKGMAERGETSDAVLIDACHNDEPTDGIYCPVEPIRTAEFLENLSKVIGADGITMFNVIDLNTSIEIQEGMKRSFMKYFVICEFRTPKDCKSANEFLLCSNKQFVNKDNDETKQFLKGLRIEQFRNKVIKTE